MKNQPYPPNWHSHTFQAMGTTINLWLETGAAPEARKAFTEVESLFQEYESVLSRFQFQSELSRLNRSTGQWTTVSPLLWSVLEKALEMAGQTHGLFDPTLLKQMEQAGYDRSFANLPGSLTIPASEFIISPRNWQDISLDPEDSSVYIPEGMGLDFGGIAKGFTAQKAAEFLEQWGPCLVDAGGDMVAGSAPSGLAGWPVSVCGPRGSGPQVDLFTLPLAKAGLATSGIDYRKWVKNGQPMHHLLDPLTGMPADTDLQVVTVWDESGSAAEAWATAAIVSGARSALAKLQAQHIPAVLITRSDQLIITREMADMAGISLARHEVPGTCK